MFDRWRDSEVGKDQSDQEYRRALTTFYQQVQSVIAGVNDITNNLSRAYPEEALSQLSWYFEGISREFTNMAMVIALMVTIINLLSNGTIKMEEIIELWQSVFPAK